MGGNSPVRGVDSEDLNSLIPRGFYERFKEINSNTDTDTDTNRNATFVILGTDLLHSYDRLKNEGKNVTCRVINSSLDKNIIIWKLLIKIFILEFPNINFILISSEFRDYNKFTDDLAAGPKCHHKVRTNFINSALEKRIEKLKFNSETYFNPKRQNVFYMNANLRTVQSPLNSAALLPDGTHLAYRWEYDYIPGSLWANCQILWNFMCRRE